MARRRVINEPIPDLNTPWSGTDAQGQYGYDKSRVEDLLKSVIGLKLGSLKTTVVDNYIHILGFATEADATTYMSDPSAHASLLLMD